MRSIIVLSMIVGFICLGLATIALIQVPVQKVSTTNALTSIEVALHRSLPASARLPEHVEYSLSDIRWNDYAFRVTHSNLWPIATFGLLFAAASHFTIAYLAWSSLRRLKK